MTKNSKIADNKNNYIVQTDNLMKTYLEGEHLVHAVDKVSLNFQKGEFTVIAGASGSGKTTLLNLIGGIDIPDSGFVSINGKNITELNEKERAAERLNRIGFIFQAYNLLPVLTAWENVQLVMQLQGVPESEHEEIISPLFEEMGLQDMKNRFPAQLSGGQQQRVAIARALAAKPDIVLADEPTANLDSETSISLINMMHSLNKHFNVTFLFSSHDPLVINNAGRIIKMLDGKVISDEQSKNTSLKDSDK